jgi:hypothetical protein
VEFIENMQVKPPVQLPFVKEIVGVANTGNAKITTADIMHRKNNGIFVMFSIIIRFHLLKKHR